MPQREPQDWSGWVLEDLEHHAAIVSLDRSLVELSPGQQDLLIAVFGEEKYNRFSASDRTLEVDRLSREQATATLAALRDSGLRATSEVRHSYSAYRTVERYEYIDDVTDEEMQRIADEMIRAGVRVIKKREEPQ